MLFNSYQFAYFFIFVISGYFITPHRFRWFLLLAASFIFYMTAKPAYAALILLSILTSYYAGIQMGRTEILSRRKIILGIVLLVHLCLLFAFKYLNFFVQSTQTVLQVFDLSCELPIIHLALPLGLSFFTFKSLSYAIDVYRGDQMPERHIGHLGLYIAFFPQLLAGPIERSKRLLPQFHEKHCFDNQGASNGLKLMLWGFFQKMVIADNLAPFVNQVYNHPSEFQGASLVLATLLFTFQIYCDFSGYSDIAIGAAQIMGFKTMDNFNRPYFSNSIRDFWRRWHISLSSWFRDYLYIPMGGNRVSVPRWYLNLFIVFLICGLWHGANWTFVVWGGIHGLYLVVGALTQRIRGKLRLFLGVNRIPKFHDLMQRGVTFLLASFAWIFFRANSLSDALYIVSHLGTGWANMPILGSGPFNKLLISDLNAGIISIALLLIVQLLQGERRFDHWLSETHPVWRWSMYYSVVLAILLFGNFGSQKFLYFQF